MRAIAFLTLFLLGGCHSARVNTYPQSSPALPDAYGVYAQDGAKLTQLHDMAHWFPEYWEQKQYLLFSQDTSILIYEKWVAGRSNDLHVVHLCDWRNMTQNPVPDVPVVSQPVENHPEMVRVIPARPLAAGLYSIRTGTQPGEEYRFGVDTPDILSYWLAVARDQPTNWQAQNHLGSALFMRNDIKGALPYFQKAVELNPKDAFSHNNVGLALSGLNRMDAAIKEFESALQFSSDPIIETNLADAYLKAGRFDQAIGAFRHALSLNPHIAEAHCNLGYALMEEGKVGDAIPEFQKAIQVDPNVQQAKADLKAAMDLQAKKN